MTALSRLPLVKHFEQGEGSEEGTKQQVKDCLWHDVGFLKRAIGEQSKVALFTMTSVCTHCKHLPREDFYLVGHHWAQWTKQEGQEKVLKLVVCQLWRALRLEQRQSQGHDAGWRLRRRSAFAQGTLPRARRSGQYSSGIEDRHQHPRRRWQAAL